MRPGVYHFVTRDAARSRRFRQRRAGTGILQAIRNEAAIVERRSLNIQTFGLSIIISGFRGVSMSRLPNYDDSTASMTARPTCPKLSSEHLSGGLESCGSSKD